MRPMFWFSVLGSLGPATAERGKLGKVIYTKDGIRFVPSIPFVRDFRMVLNQSSSSPPTISMSVENTSPTEFVTFLKWGSPLDPDALNMGLVHIAPTVYDEPIDIPRLFLQHPSPPGLESLVTLQPGETMTNFVELRQPDVPEDVWVHGKASVKMTGYWRNIWPEVTADEVVRNTEKFGEVGGQLYCLKGKEWASEIIRVKGPKNRKHASP